MEHTSLISNILLKHFVFSGSILAYLDPGSGSFILQLILASLVGSLFVFKNFWKRVVSFFRGIFSRDQSNKE
ncbi:MAG: hypothetical protein JSV61_00270 [Anaerolineales bacterium]|nr:MAG: hypothetical protein JSV61_00270 [Anaerolineales bacterium]